MDTELTVKIGNQISADIFEDEDLYDYQSAMYRAELGGILRKAQAATFCSQLSTMEYLVTHSLKDAVWQVTSVRHGVPYSDYQADSLEEVLDRLPDAGIEKAKYIPKGEGEKHMMFEESRYISPNGSKIEDG